MSPVVRIDPEVKRRLDEERRPDERNYNAAIHRILRRYKILKPPPNEIVFRWPS